MNQFVEQKGSVVRFIRVESNLRFDWYMFP